MADRADLDFTYSLTDRIFRLSLGELADFSGAKYDGNFSLSLEEAQRRKHEHIAEQIGIGPGRRVLDLGCGWGGLLDFIRRRGATGVGVTLSSAQLRACRRHGLDVRLSDARGLTREGFGAFDAVASLGAFEHFCSREQHRAGRQEEIDIAAPRDSDAWYLALMGRQFPGSWLPSGPEQVVRTAEPDFRLVSSASGRLDYIQTIREWRRRFAVRSPRKALLKVRLVPRWATSPDFRLAFTSGVSANSVCFERELLDHFRLTFERV